MNRLRNRLILIFLAGVSGTFHFWPSDTQHKEAAFFSLLQFVAAFALILLTFLYVTATQANLEATKEQLADQNSPPKITITYNYVPGSDPFVMAFEVQAANPSVRATSLAVKSLQIGEFSAREMYFEVNQTRMGRITIQARDLMNVIVKATNFNPPGVPITIGSKTPAVLTFEDIFHGPLSVVVEV